MSPLERALVALDAGDDAAALTALVEAWRERRSPQLAELVELLDSRQPTRPFADLVTPRIQSTLARLRSLADADDPRLGDALVDMLEHAPFTSMPSRPFWQLVFDIALTVRDPRLPSRADALRAALSRHFLASPLRALVLRGVDALVRIETPLRDPTEAERTLEDAIDERLAPVRRKRERERELLAEIYADPTADGPRSIYADVLQERGDPHGELIALQLERHGRDLVPSRREIALLSRYGKRWLAGLAGVVSLRDPSRFERGFLASAAIDEHAYRALPSTWQDPAWSTVEELLGPFQLDILHHAPLLALRRADVGLSGLEALSTRPPLPHLADLTVGWARIDRDDLERLAHCQKLPGLRRLTLRFDVQDDLASRLMRHVLAAPVAARLEHLHVDSAQIRLMLDGDAQPAWFLQLLELTLSLPATIPRITFRQPTSRALPLIVLERDASGRYQRVS